MNIIHLNLDKFHTAHLSPPRRVFIDAAGLGVLHHQHSVGNIEDVIFFFRKQENAWQASKTQMAPNVN